MGKNERKTDNRYLVMIGVIVCVVVLTAVVTVFVLVWGGTHDQDDHREEEAQTTTQVEPIEELIIHSIEEQENTVDVSTSYGVFKYPFAFSDIIRTEAIELKDGTALEFTAMIAGESYNLYTICFGSEEGIPVGKIKIGEKKQSYNVGVIFYDLDEKLDEQYHSTFYAALETFNDVVDSMEENENFTSLY